MLSSSISKTTGVNLAPFSQYNPAEELLGPKRSSQRSKRDQAMLVVAALRRWIISVSSCVFPLPLAEFPLNGMRIGAQPGFRSAANKYMRKVVLPPPRASSRRAYTRGFKRTPPNSLDSIFTFSITILIAPSMLALISTNFSAKQETLDGVILEQSKTDLLKSTWILGTSN